MVQEISFVKTTGTRLLENWYSTSSQLELSVQSIAENCLILIISGMSGELADSVFDSLFVKLIQVKRRPFHGHSLLPRVTVMLGYSFLSSYIQVQ